MRHIVTLLAIAGLTLPLGGCPSSTSSAYQSNLAALAAGAPLWQAALASYPGLVTPAVSKAETDLNAAIAAMQASPAPTSATAILTDIRAVAAAMPPNVLSPAHQAELSAALALAQSIAAASATAPVSS